MSNEMITIATQFSRSPVGRYGPKSGQMFREELLLPALQKGGVEKVTVDLNGALGFGSSFLEEVFGGLVRAGLVAGELRKRLVILSDVKTYTSCIWQYIDEAQAQASDARVVH